MGRILDTVHRERATVPDRLELPELGQRLSFTTAAFADMPARVVRMEHTDITLELLGAVPRTASGPRGSARVEYTVPEGLVRLFGSAGGALDLISDAVGPCLSFAARGNPMMLLRRSQLRVKMRAEAELGDEIHQTLDVSAGGMLVSGPVPFETDAEIDFRLRLPDELCAVSGRARVARIDADGNAGVEFSRVSDDDRARLERAVIAMRRSRRG